MNKILITTALLLSALSTQAQTDQSAGFIRRCVVEEYTGTWCGNCPRGIVGLNRLAEDFGDRFIGIAIHTGDSEPMVIPTYPSLVPGAGGIPACTIDRAGKLDPYSGGGSRGAFHYGIDVEFAYRLNQPTEAGLELTAQWNDQQQWDVRFTATTTFCIDSPDAPYRLAFILLEDGMKGEGKAWQQVNYFSTETDFTDSKNYSDDDMKVWREAPYLVSDMVYDHVPVNTLGIKDGIAGSISAPIVSGESQTFSSLVTTINVRVIQDKERLSAVAILLNTQTGEIVNAAKASILPYGTDGILPAVSNEPPYRQSYDLLGRPLNHHDTQGISIERQPSSGKYVKRQSVNHK
jgi:thiol-disulfide isomerase/thioredoxin